MGEQFQHRLPNQNIMKTFVAILLFISVVISGIVGHPRPSDDFDLSEAEADPRVFGLVYPKRDMANRQYAAPSVQLKSELLARRPDMKSRQGRVAPLVELTSELLARRPDQKRKMDDFDLAEAEADPRRVARQSRAAPLVELTSELLARRPDMKSKQGRAPLWWNISRICWPED